MRRRALLPLLTVGIGLLIGLAAAEIVLRLGGYWRPPVSRRDDYCGTLRRPGIEWDQTDEGGARIRINAAGFRDDEWTREKPPGTFRIAVLGDSYVEAGQVAVGERFTEVLERELDRSSAVGGRRVEVLTFGMAGFGTAQELMSLRHYAWPYAPDLVVLAVTTGNDVRNNSKALQSDGGRPYFTYVGGTFTLDDSFRQSAAHRRTWQNDLAFWVIDRSRAAQFAYRAWQDRASMARRALTRQAVSAARTGEEAGLDGWIYAEPSGALQDEAWRITEDLFALMHREVVERGARFVLVTLSNGIQVNPDADVREAYMRRLGVDDLFYPERRIQAAGARHGYPVVNLAPVLLEYARAHRVFLHGFGAQAGEGHWNHAGHEVAGRLLAGRVRALLEEAPSDADGRPVSGGSE
jgi:hypothetical protein